MILMVGWAASLTDFTRSAGTAERPHSLAFHVPKTHSSLTGDTASLNLVYGSLSPPTTGTPIARRACSVVLQMACTLNADTVEAAQRTRTSFALHAHLTAYL